MMDLVNVFASLQEASHSTEGFFAGVMEYLKGLNLGAGELSVGGAVVVLAVVWVCVRIVRAVASVLLAIGVLLLVLHFAGVVDLSGLWAQLQTYLGAESSNALFE